MFLVLKWCSQRDGILGRMVFSAGGVLCAAALSPKAVPVRLTSSMRYPLHGRVLSPRQSS
jgi:hypothetical protein